MKTEITLEEKMKNSLVQIIGRENEGTFFVLDFVESLRGKTAELKSVSTNKTKILRDTPISQLKTVTPRSRNPIDCFAKIAVQSLKMIPGDITGLAFHCNTKFKPYQFRPLLKFSRNPSKRILVADETGLGKTIEAGYIIVNEMSKELIARIVILCPSNLKHKWAGELWRRFGLRFEVVNGKRLFSIISNEESFSCIASIDCLKPIEAEKLINFPSKNEIDLLIIDELHHMIGRSGDTLRRRLGLALSSISKRVVGLTATPIHLELLDLKRVLDVVNPGFKTKEEFETEAAFNTLLNRLCKILSKGTWKSEDYQDFSDSLQVLREKSGNREYLGNFDELSAAFLKTDVNDKNARYILRKQIQGQNTFSNFFNRTTKVEVGEKRERKILNERIALSSDTFRARQEGRETQVSEESLFKEVDDFLKLSFHPIHRRQLSSCLRATMDLLRAGMRGFNVWVGDCYKEYEVALDEKQRARCRSLVNKFNLLTKDSKWDRLKMILLDLHERKVIRKAIVFTEWIPTINYFRRRKGELGVPCYVVSGMDKEQNRLASIQDFGEKEGFAVLFTTDVMSEGIDLQSADCVINYDLPYNPQKIEQRIGRIDRIGQESNQLRIINLLVEGSTDETVYDTLLERLGVFEQAVGDLPNTLMDKIETEDVIDEDSIIQALKEHEIRNELLRSDLFAGLDDVLDEEIKTLWMKSQRTAYDLRWLVFERLMFMIMGEEKVKKATVDNNTLSFPDFETLDLQALASLVPIKDEASIISQLQSAKTKDGHLKFSFKRDSEGLYLSPFHPLMLKAAELCYRSFYDYKHSSEVETQKFICSGRFEGQLAKTKTLFLVEFLFEGKIVRRKDWFWWSLYPDGEIKKLETDPLKQVWQTNNSKPVALEPETDNMPLPSEITDDVLQSFESWKQALEKQDLNNFLAAKKNELIRFEERLKEIVAISGKGFKCSKPEEIAKTAKEIEAEVQELRKTVADIEVNIHNYYKCIRVNYRLISVICLEGPTK